MTKISPPAAPSVGFISLGCPKNLVDSEVMMGLLDRAGARLTANPEDAEILVVNTCSFIDTAKQESVDTILEMARLKSTGRAKKLIVAGCLVERYRDEIQKNIPEVDAVVGTGELESVLEAAGLEARVPPIPRTWGPGNESIPSSPFTILTSTHAEIRSGKESQSGTHKNSIATNTSRPEGRSGKESQSGTHKKKSPNRSADERHEVSGHDFSRAEKAAKRNGALASEGSQPASRKEGDARERSGRFLRDAWAGASSALPTYLYDENTPRLLSTPRASAYIKIAEGCDHPCTFCVIPNLRGKFRSRRFESVVAEAEQLVARGVREITLIGQDTTCYGEDLGLRDGLATLLDTLARIPDLKWLRFLYAYPNRVTGKLLETIAKHENICKYLDLPLQHASSNVLKRMKRGAGVDIFLKTLAKVRSAVPGIALRTSFIVGFPGESVEDFAVLQDFITEAKFDWLGVFSYSHEEGSAAYALDSQTPNRTIESRRRRLMKLQQSISRRAKKNWVGRELTVLAEGPSAETPLLWEARSEFHAPEIDGKVFINDFGSLDDLEAGRFYRAVVTESHDYDLVARILTPAN